MNFESEELLTDRRRRQLRLVGAIAAVVAVFVGFGAVAWSGWGLLAGALFGVGVVLGAIGPPATILLFRDGLPLGGLVGAGLAIAAQVAFGKAGLVRRADGQYEWGVLRETDGGYCVELDSGTTVPIDATEGELFSFGFGKLAVVEAHSDVNVGPYQELHTPGEATTPVEHRAGIPVAPPRQEDGGILVSLSKIQRRVRGSASSSLVRRGRDKALDEQGGTGQLSPLWTMAFATVLLMVGFGMTAGVLML